MKKSLLKKLLGVVLAGAVTVSGGLMQFPVYADETEPNKVKDSISYGGALYYNANSSSFDKSQKQFYMDLLNAPIGDRMGYEDFIEFDDNFRKYSVADNWLWLALRLNWMDKSYDAYSAGERFAVEAIDHQNVKSLDFKPTSVNDAFMSPLTYHNNQGKDEFYMMLWNNYRCYYVIFRDFSVTALLPDAGVKGNYISTTVENGTVLPDYSSGVRNESNAPATQTIDTSESGTVSMTSSVNGSSSYSFSEGIKLGAEANFLCGKVSEEVSLSSTQAFQSGWSRSNTESQTYSKAAHYTRTLPPYSESVMENGTTDVTVTTRYNCPVGLNYTVDILSGGTQLWDPAKDPDAKSWNGLRYTFGSDARKDIYQRYYIDGKLDSVSDKDRGLDKEGIIWKVIQEWGGYGCFTNSTRLEALSTYVPMSSAGAILTETQNSNFTRFKEIAPIYPLSYVKLEAPKDVSVISGKISYDNVDYLSLSMPVGKKSYTKYFNLEGYNNRDGLYCNFNKDYGYWVLTDEDGNELGSDAPVKLEKIGGNTAFTAVKPGTCYLTYRIDEKSYPTGVNNDTYVTNRDLSRTAMMEIVVEEPEFKYQLKIDGSYVGIVDAKPENIEGDGKLEGIVLDSTGKEVDMEYIWDAQQPPSKGINLSEDGTVSFTRARSFNVRIMTPDRKHYSDWYPISVKALGSDEEIDVVDDAKYRIADEGTVLFVDGSFKGSTNGEAVNIEGEGKLVVSAEDLSGDELPILYEWEQFGVSEDGLELSKDGTAVFTKPGAYFVRVKSGTVTSDWVEITAHEPAVIRTAPTPKSHIYDGEDVCLITDPGMAVGGEMAYVAVKDDASVPPADAYTKELPTGAWPGNYHVWYKAIGDGEHGDSPADHIEVVIYADQGEYKAAVAAAEAFKTSLKSVKAKKGGNAVAQWKKNSYADGYQLEYSTNKNFSGTSTSVLEMESADTLNAKVTGLEKGKKYFFRIRTIKVIYDPVEGSESRIFGKWSKIKKIKAR